MSNEPGKECLELLAEEANSQFNKEKILGEIENYVKFYAGKHKVPKNEIFLGATVSSQRLLEICQNPTVTIILAKSGQSSDVGKFEQFKFIILGSDYEGNTLLDAELALPNEEYVEQFCCKRPKGG